MTPIEFTAELGKDRVVEIPQEIAAKLPQKGRVRVIIMSTDRSGDAEWRTGAYEQFVREDSPDDSVYDNYR